MKAQHVIEFTRLERDKINLQSTVASLEAEVVGANNRMLTLESALAIARKEGEILKADWVSEVTRLQRDKFDVQSALGALKTAVAEGKQSLSLGIGDFKQWMRESSVNPDTLISDLDQSISSTDIHHVLVHNALLKVRSQIWGSAYEDANKVIFHSVIHVV